MTRLSSWYIYTRAMLNEERKIVSQYCLGWPACCSQQMGEDSREDLKDIFCVRLHVIFIQLLHAHAPIFVLPACLPTFHVRTVGWTWCMRRKLLPYLKLWPVYNTIYIIIYNQGTVVNTLIMNVQ